MVTQNGQQLGPFTLKEVNAALAGGELSPDDLAWHEGAPGWIMLGAVDGVVTPHSTRSMPLPPPVRSVLVADELEDGQISSQAFGYAYSIIVAVGIIAEIVLEAATQGKTSIPWLVYAGAYGGIYVWEKKQLSDPSLLPSSWWLLLVPAYIYKRAKAFRQPMGSFWTFNALLVLSIFIAVAKDNTLTRGARESPSGDQGSATTIRQMAEKGDAAAQLKLGVMYKNGEEVNYAEAAKWFRKAADQGNAEAQLRLGNAYDDGEGVVKNKAEAVKWYRKAADQGNAYAQVKVSLCYDRGEGVVKDDVESYKWDLIAGATGNPDAQKNITIAERRLTPAQRAEGQRRANAWKPVK